MNHRRTRRTRRRQVEHVFMKRRRMRRTRRRQVQRVFMKPCFPRRRRVRRVIVFSGKRVLHVGVACTVFPGKRVSHDAVARNRCFFRFQTREKHEFGKPFHFFGDKKTSRLGLHVGELRSPRPPPSSPAREARIQLLFVSSLRYR